MSNFQSLENHIEQLTIQAEHGDGELLKDILSNLTFQQIKQILKDIATTNARRLKAMPNLPVLRYYESNEANDGASLVDLRKNGVLEYQAENRPADNEIYSAGYDLFRK